MNGVTFYDKFGSCIILISNLFRILPRRMRHTLFNHCRNIQGQKGILLRYILFRNLVKRCGLNVSIKEGAFLLNLDNIECGSNLSIHEMCYIDGYGGIVIGDNVSISHSCSLISFNHTWNEEELPIKYNKPSKKKIIVGNDVWIGGGSRILGGVTIGNRCVIGAGAVVNKDVESHTIVGGVPARLLKSIR